MLNIKIIRRRSLKAVDRLFLVLVIHGDDATVVSHDHSSRLPFIPNGTHPQLLIETYFVRIWIYAGIQGSDLLLAVFQHTMSVQIYNLKRGDGGGGMAQSCIHQHQRNKCPISPSTSSILSASLSQNSNYVTKLPI